MYKACLSESDLPLVGKKRKRDCIAQNNRPLDASRSNMVTDDVALSLSDSNNATLSITADEGWVEGPPVKKRKIQFKTNRAFIDWNGRPINIPAYYWFPFNVFDEPSSVAVHQSIEDEDYYSVHTSIGFVEFDRILGKGTHGTVYFGKMNNLELSLKRFSTTDDNEWSALQDSIKEWFFNCLLDRQAYLLVSDSNAKLIKRCLESELGTSYEAAHIRHVGTNSDPLCLMPYLGYDYKKVFDTLTQRAKKKNPNGQYAQYEKMILLYIFQQIVRSLQRLHRLGVIHFDAKLPNFVAKLPNPIFNPIDFAMSILSSHPSDLLSAPYHIRIDNRVYLSRITTVWDNQNFLVDFVDIYSLFAHTTMDRTFERPLRTWFSRLAITRLIEFADKSAYEANYSSNNFWVCVIQVLKAGDVFQALDIQRTQLDNPNHCDSHLLTILQVWFLTLVAKRLMSISLLIEGQDCSNLVTLVQLKARNPSFFDSFSLEGFNKAQLCEKLSIKALPSYAFLMNQHHRLASNVLPSAALLIARHWSFGLSAGAEQNHHEEQCRLVLKR